MMSPGEHRQVRVPIPFEERFFFFLSFEQSRNGSHLFHPLTLKGTTSSQARSSSSVVGMSRWTLAFQVEMCLLHYPRPKKKMLSGLPTMTLKPRGIEGATNRTWASQRRFSGIVVSATRPEAWIGTSTVHTDAEMEGSHTQECGPERGHSWLKGKRAAKQRGTSLTKAETLGFSGLA